MLIVIVGFDASGKSSTLRPLGRRYSVMPSTVVTLVAPGAWAIDAAGATNARLMAKRETKRRRVMAVSGSVSVSAPARLVEYDPARHRDVQALHRSVHRDGNQEVARILGEAPQAFAFGAEHQAERAFELRLVDQLRGLVVGAHHPDAAILEV